MTTNHSRRWGAVNQTAQGTQRSRNNNNSNRTTPPLGTGAGRGNSYGPPGAGRGRTSGPRSMGQVSALEPLPQRQGNTSLYPLTGRRSSGGGTVLASSGIQDVQATHKSGKTTSTLRLEMQKITPTESMEKLWWQLQEKDVTTLTLEDFTTEDTNVGKSVLITLLVNFVSTMRPELGETQRARIAAHAAVHHPIYLHEALLDGDTALELTKSFLATRPVKLEIEDLCPMDTPYLIIDTELRESMGQLPTTPPTELRRMITPFLQGFYPGDWELLEQVIREVSGDQLQEFISLPGNMHEYFITTNQACKFDPPQWTTPSAFHKNPHTKPAHIATQGTQADSDEDSVDSADLLQPLREMRIDQAEFAELEPEIQKKRILAVFPTRMATVLPADVLGYMIVMLSEMSAISIQGAMDPYTFH